MPAAETHTFVERLVLWYEFYSDGKFSHVKLLIKEKYSRKGTDSAAFSRLYDVCGYLNKIFELRLCTLIDTP